MNQANGPVPPEVARACATLGIRPGCSARALKTQYKRLIKKWHPDQFAYDPVGQAEATQRTRAIIQAYGTVEAYENGHAFEDVQSSEVRDPRSEVTAQPRETVVRGHVESRGATHWTVSGRPLTAAEKDAIVRALRYRNPVLVGIGYLAWMIPVLLAFVILSGHRRWSPTDLQEVLIGPTVPETIVGVLLLSFAVGVLVRGAWRRGRR